MTTAESDKSQKTPRAVAKNSFDEGERKAVGKALAAINKVNLFYTVLIFFNNFAFVSNQSNTHVIRCHY